MSRNNYTPSGYPPTGTVFNHPTQWVLKQKWLNSSMYIQDANGADIFKAHNKFLTIGWSLTFEDARWELVHA